MVRLGINSGTLTSYDHLVTKNALKQARLFWEEEIATGNPVRDSLQYPDAVTGQPNQLAAGIRAATAVLQNGGRYRAGTWVLRWTGIGTVRVDWGHGITAVDDTTGRVTASIPTPTDGFIIRITATNIANPVRLTSLTHIDDELSPSGFQAWWIAAWRLSGNKQFRALNWMDSRTLTTPSAIRLDTWWTESDEALDSYRVGMGGTMGTTALGQRRNIWRGGVEVGYGFIVRLVAADVWHFRVAGGSLQQWDDLRLVGSPSGPYVAEISAADTGAVGCSMALLGQVSQALDLDLHVSMPYNGNDATHLAMLTAIRDGVHASRKVWVEWTNETWNTMFAQYAYCNAQGAALGVPSPGGEPWYQGAQYYALRSDQVHEIARGVFAGQLHRLECVFAGQNSAGEHWFHWRTIINPDSQAGFPLYPHRVIPMTAWAVAPYFQGSKGAAHDNLNNADYVAMTDAQLETNLRADMTYRLRAAEFSAPYRDGGLALFATLCAERTTLQGGVVCKLICYEAGQHITSPPDATVATQNRLMAYQNSTHMRTLYDDYIEAVDAIGTHTLLFYNSDGRWGPGAMFGMYDTPIPSLADESKYQAFLTAATAGLHDRIGAGLTVTTQVAASVATQLPHSRVSASWSSTAQVTAAVAERALRVSVSAQWTGTVQVAAAVGTLIPQGGGVHERETTDAQVDVVLAPARWERVEVGVRIGRGAPLVVTTQLAPARGELIPLAAHIGVSANWTVLLQLAPTFAMRLPDVLPVIHERQSAGLLVQVLVEASDGRVERDPYIGVSAPWEIAHYVAPAAGTRLPRIPHEAQAASWSHVVELTAAVATHSDRTGTLTGPRRLHQWTALLERRHRKRVGIVIERGALLSWSKYIDPVGAERCPVVFPLAVGEKFAGVAVETAIETDDYVPISLRGSFLADVAGVVIGDVDVPVAALDDQQLVVHDEIVPAVLVGRCYRDPNGLAAVTYEAEVERSLEALPGGGDEVPIQPPVF